MPCQNMSDWSKSPKKDFPTAAVDHLIIECVEQMAVALNFISNSLLEASHFLSGMGPMSVQMCRRLMASIK